MEGQRSLWRSFVYALRGVIRAMRTEPNFQLHILATSFVIGLMVIFPVERFEVLILLMAIVAVLILELVNIAIERLVDIMKPRLHFYAGVVKDVTAASVLIASLGALVIGLCIFVPYIQDLFAQ